jgi:hypothetical protein
MFPPLTYEYLADRAERTLVLYEKVDKGDIKPDKRKALKALKKAHDDCLPVNREKLWEMGTLAGALSGIEPEGPHDDHYRNFQQKHAFLGALEAKASQLDYVLRPYHPESMFGTNPYVIKSMGDLVDVLRLGEREQDGIFVFKMLLNEALRDDGVCTANRGAELGGRIRSYSALPNLGFGGLEEVACGEVIIGHLMDASEYPHLRRTAERIYIQTGL